MTKIEVIEHLIGQSDEMVQVFATKWSDEKLIESWNYRDRFDNKGLRLKKVDNEFVIEFYAPLCDFFADAWKNSVQNIN